jgi:hypothetical protein
MTYFVYGGTQFDSGVVNLTRMNIRYRHSKRGKRISRIDTLFLQGEICEDGESAVLTEINNLATTFNTDYQNARLYLDDGTPTPHGLTNDSPFCMTGVRVIERSWPKGGPEELANMRTWHVTLEAEYADCESQILEWSETLEFIGTTGPRYEVVETYFGPYANLECLRTSQRIIQSGSALGYSANVLPPGPLFPQNEHVDRRVEKVGSGQCLGNQYAYFPTYWTYYFSSATPLYGLPITR